MDDFETPDPPPRKSNPLAKIGWWVGGAGFLLALGAVAVLGQGVSNFEAAASAIHRIALVIMLSGLLIALAGHRLNWVQGRLSERRATLIQGEVLDAEIVEPSSVVGPVGRKSEPEVTTDFLATVGYAFGLAVVIAIGELLLLVLDESFGLIVAGFLTIVMVGVHALTAFLSRAYLRAFALGALVPSGVLLCLTPLMFAASSRFAPGPELLGLAMLGWLTVIPAGLAGAGVLAARRASRPSQGNPAP